MMKSHKKTEHNRNSTTKSSEEEGDSFENDSFFKDFSHEEENTPDLRTEKISSSVNSGPNKTEAPEQRVTGTGVFQQEEKTEAPKQEVTDSGALRQDCCTCSGSSTIRAMKVFLLLLLLLHLLG